MIGLCDLFGCIVLPFISVHKLWSIFGFNQLIILPLYSEILWRLEVITFSPDDYGQNKEEPSFPADEKLSLLINGLVLGFLELTAVVTIGPGSHTTLAPHF